MKEKAIVVILLAFMAIIAIASMANDSLTMDEKSHLPAGYSYITQMDMRINPEHPPLIKDLAGIPLAFMNLEFPSDINAWKQETNAQWNYGYYFLYNTGNPVDKMVFWARLPMILILIILGIYVYIFARELFGKKTALLALFFYTFSPTLLAHGRLVTTDVGATTGAFISTYYFIKFLKNDSKKNLIIAGIFLGIAELLKYSLILLIPFFGLLILVYSILKSSSFKEFLKVFVKYALKTLIIGLICTLLISIVYLYHTFNYPAEKQIKDTQILLSSISNRGMADITAKLAGIPVLRAPAWYLVGLFMVLQRAAGGNTGYFMGEISNLGWKAYFPTVYLLKEPLAFHILLLISIISLIIFLAKRIRKNPKVWLNQYFVELAMILFIAIYWFTSLRSNLNIGVRHLLPVFPFTILLVSKSTAKLMKGKISMILISILLLWQAVSVISVFPHFLSYFNELAGGPANGYKYVVDSNYDWGQDLKRLKDWTDKNNIDKIYVDYFGGGSPEYYLKDKFISWNGYWKESDFKKGNYLAVSATPLQNGRGKPMPGFQYESGFYNWLDKYSPIARIGYSIFVYRID